MEPSIFHDLAGEFDEERMSNMACFPVFQINETVFIRNAGIRLRRAFLLR